MLVIKKYAGVANGTDSGSSDPFNVGYQTNGWDKLSTHPLYFTRAGYLWSDEYRDTTTLLDYWSATSRSSSVAYHLYAYSGVLYPALSSNRAYGFSVRCVKSFALDVCYTILCCIISYHTLSYKLILIIYRPPCPPTAPRSGGTFRCRGCSGTPAIRHRN